MSLEANAYRPLVEIQPDFSFKEIGDVVSLFEDKDHRYEISNIYEVLHQFQKSTRKVPNFGYSSSTYWLYFDLVSRFSKDIVILLEVSYPLLDYIDFYVFDGKALVKHISTGDRRIFFERDLQHKNFLVTIEMEPQKEYRVFVKIRSQGSIQVPIRLLNHKRYVIEEHFNQLMQGIYYGIMVAMVFYNLFLLLSIKDLTYLYYIVYILGISLFNLVFTGYAFEYLWPYYPDFGNQVMPFSIGFLAFFGSIFSVKFLRLRNYSLVFYRLFLALIVIYFSIMVLSFILSYEISIKIANYTIILFAFLSISSSLLTYKKGWKPARFYFISWIALLVGMLLLALKQLGLLPSNFLTNYGVQIGSASEVILLSLALADRVNVLKEEKEKAEREILETKVLMLESFSRFVPKHFVNILQKESILDIKKGDATEKEITVMFNDLKNFTVIAEMLNTKETFEFLNKYLEVMSPIILNHRGIIDKFVGDEIMALFDQSVDDSLDAAIAMRRALKNFNESVYNLNLPYVEMGIGINHGKLMLGTVGSEERLDTTVIGDTVNVASRIQQLTRHYGVPIILTENAVSNIRQKEKYYLRKLIPMRIKGKIDPIRIYECFNTDQEEKFEKKLETLPKYNEALYLFETKKFKDSFEIFEEILKSNPNDHVIHFYLEKMRQMNLES
ncbi:MAG: hypothetical protein NZ853_05650 [Leptospiraceae bacterium]|nr:hypothetical protein [Leptospiraceae bacterium]MDW7976567.1 7TM diverse intracellular signaling domain-containing protein [Leptospiraceae bacterium]